MPWQELVFSLDEGFNANQFQQIMESSQDLRDRKRKLIRTYFKDISWTVPGSRVVDNILSEAVSYCM